MLFPWKVMMVFDYPMFLYCFIIWLFHFGHLYNCSLSQMLWFTPIMIKLALRRLPWGLGYPKLLSVFYQMCAKEEKRGGIITEKFTVYSFVANSVDFSKGRRENEGKRKRRSDWGMRRVWEEAARRGKENIHASYYVYQSCPLSTIMALFNLNYPH